MDGNAETVEAIHDSIRIDAADALVCPSDNVWPAAALQDLASITVATTSAELEAIGRLRHALYVARDGKAYGHADSASGVFLEPVDRVSLNLQALAGARLLAAVRLTRAADAECDRHLRLLIEALGAVDLTRSVIASRLAVRPEKEARARIETIFRDAYRRGIASGARHCFIATRDSLVGMFLRAGFRPHARSYLDPVAGRLQPMLFDASGGAVLHVQRHASRSHPTSDIVNSAGSG